MKALGGNLTVGLLTLKQMVKGYLGGVEKHDSFSFKTVVWDSDGNAGDKPGGRKSS